MRVIRVVILLLLLAVPPPARAQQVMSAANVANELDSVTAVAVSREIARARERGIPVEPLLAKVREGRFKSAGGPLIRTAVAKLAARLDSARAVLGGSSTNAELVAGAEALAAGAGIAALRAIRAATPRSIEAALGTLAQLIMSGVKPPRALEMIVSLLKRNAAPALVLALGNYVEGDVAAGMRPDESAIIRLRGIEGSLGFSSGDAVTVSAPGGTVNNPPPKASKPTRRP